MPQRTSYAQGTPNWVDIQTTDQEAAKSFYGQLLGWTFEDMAMPDGASYSMAHKEDSKVAAIAPQSPDMKAMGAPPAWNTYLAVDDVDAAAGRVAAAGGQLAMEPFDVMEAGRMAFVLDPGGAGVALWQAKGHMGATLVNEPGCLIWNELVTSDVERALPFYADVVGLSSETVEMGGSPYALLKAGDEQVAGCTAPQQDGVPNHWLVYFAVENVAAAVARVAELGGSVVTAPFNTPIGDMAVVSDPQGAVFSLYAPAGEVS
jgi:predicted enzyme related to lactoylglutathione lyase